MDGTLTRWIGSVVHSGHAPGAVVAAIRDGVETTLYFGQKARAGGLVDGSTRFEIGSLTKTYTGLLFASMVARGEVSANDPIIEYLPPSGAPRDPAAARITLDQLATHTSGVPRVPLAVLFHSPLRWLDNPYAGYSLNDLYRTSSRMRLRHPPGSRVRYSTFGIGLLGQVLANAAGMTYPQLLAERITAPLGLTMTGTEVAPTDATGHRRGRPVPHWQFQALAPAGAIRTTGADLLRYLRAHVNATDTPLADAVASIRRPPHPTWQRHRTAGHTVLWHTGGTGGFTSFAGYSLDTGTAIAVLANACVNRHQRVIRAARGAFTDILFRAANS